MSQLTTHILDTTKGRPAQGVTIVLYRGGNDARLNPARPPVPLPDLVIQAGVRTGMTWSDGDAVGREWMEMARGITNADGRITDLLKKDVVLQHGIYKMRFETKDYFDKAGIATFYPYIEITFDLQADEQYHIPLLLNPFGYSTYRGS